MDNNGTARVELVPPNPEVRDAEMDDDDDVMEEEQVPATGSSVAMKAAMNAQECVESTSVGYAFQLINEQKVDVLIAPPCIDGAILAAHVGTFYNVPVMIWGPCFDSSFTHPDLFPTVILSNVMCASLSFFSWNVMALIYQSSENGICGTFQKDMEEAGMDDSEYMYIIPGLRLENKRFSNGSIDPDFTSYSLKSATWWLDTRKPSDGRDADAWKIARLSYRLQVDSRSEVVTKSPNFYNDVMDRMEQWPFYCMDCNRSNVTASPYATTLYDAMYLYGLALSRVINQSGFTNVRNGEVITKNTNLQFEGLSGSISISRDGTSDSRYFLVSYKSFESNLVFPQLSFRVFDGGVQNVSWSENASKSTMWETRGGVQPLSTPLCGFDGKGCPINFFEEYKGYWISAMVLGLFVIAGVFLGIYYVIK
ncbi:receptor family ligand binding region domain-containing protein [Ditylenchus destructor]|nr:receptor family ligand binding region domain-containing protein [Ditylenchus destructor]